jgi:opacity protein-like surface antigen
VGFAVFKRLLLGLGLACFCAPAANAADHGWYWGVEAGFDQANDAATMGTTAIWFTPPPVAFTFPFIDVFQFDIGYGAFATVGTHVAPNLRIEAEIGYRHEQADRHDPWAEVTLMLYGNYDIALSSQLTLSLGAGIGADAINGEFSETDYVLAYQGVVGLSYALTPSTDVTIKYRALQAQGPTFDRPLVPFVGPIHYDIDDIEHQSFSVGLRFAL